MRNDASKPKKQPTRQFSPGRTIRKYFVTAFVVLTFIAYALHERMINPDGASNADPSGGSSSPAHQVVATPQAPPAASQLVLPAPAVPDSPPTVTPVPPASQRALPPTSAPTAQPTATPPAAVANGKYKDGTFTGDQVDAFFGLVEVQAVIQNGKLTNVQVPEYPSDRRTSVRINSVAIPYLQSEALQAQSANVDIVSGATLTSEAFAMSLQAALDAAKN